MSGTVHVFVIYKLVFIVHYLVPNPVHLGPEAVSQIWLHDFLLWVIISSLKTWECLYSLRINQMCLEFTAFYKVKQFKNYTDFMSFTDFVYQIST